MSAVAVGVSLWKSSPVGVSNCTRMSMANRPPRKKATRTEIKYITPIRLWSSVKIQVEMPRLCVR